MSDYINRQDAIDATWEEPTYTDPINVLTEVRDRIKALSSAQRTGEWIQKPNIYGVAYCSECDYELHTNDTNYCPNCGADMRGDNNV